MDKKYILCWIPVLIHPCVGNGKNALSIHPKVRIITKGDDPKDSSLEMRCCIGIRSIVCCHCGTDLTPTHWYVFQKVSDSAVKPFEIRGIVGGNGWCLVGIVKGTFRLTGSLN